MRRSRLRTGVPAVAALLIVSWLAPTAPQVAARSSRDDTTGSGCGDDWSSADLIDTLDGGLLEVSGFVSSALHPGVAWMIRDSKNPDSLYSFRLDGDTSSWKEFPISGGTSNSDWEDVAYTVGSDGRGRLWILENDFAGSESHDSSMKIYEVIEPDPDHDHSAHLAATYRFEYPDDEDHDTEALFALGGELLVVTKTDPDRVFRLPSPLSRSGTNHLIEVGDLDAGSLLTAVGVSGDEELLVTVGISDDVTVFKNRSQTSQFSAFDHEEPLFRRSMPETQREAIDFFPHDSCDIVSVSEDGSVWRLSNPRSIHPYGLPPGPPAPAPEPVAPPAERTPAESGPGAVTSTGPVRDGYWMLDADGTVYPFGAARHFGNATADLHAEPAVDLEPTSSGAGYWIVDDRGRVHVFGDAGFFGEVNDGVLARGEAVTSLSATPAGDGYWLFTDRGRVLAFGAARHLGDVSAVRLNAPVLDSVATPTGAGYYMVAADGGIFTFGDAVFSGSMGGTRLNAPVQSLVPDGDGAGYWLVASDGGVFAFGAPFRGSLGSVRLNKPVTGMVRFGAGYLMVGEDGGIFNFSDRTFAGSLGGHPPAMPVVAVAALG
ncbi:MAG: hypothetical protein ACRD0C_20405 [Acidimicrobiia bacterium]